MKRLFLAVVMMCSALLYADVIKHEFYSEVFKTSIPMTSETNMESLYFNCTFYENLQTGEVTYELGIDRLRAEYSDIKKCEAIYKDLKYICDNILPVKDTKYFTITSFDAELKDYKIVSLDYSGKSHYAYGLVTEYYFVPVEYIPAFTDAYKEFINFFYRSKAEFGK